MTTQNTPDFGNIKVVRAGSTRSTTPVSATQTPAIETRSVIVPAEPAPLKKSIARFWWLPLLLVLGIAATVWGRNYYQARYVGSDYWAQVPADQNMTLVQQRNSAGEPVPGYQVRYRLTAFNEAGDQRTLEFDSRGDDVSAMPQPGDFVWISASKQLVVRQRVVPQSEVAANVLNLIAHHG